jgi:hypothetical protein
VRRGRTVSRLTVRIKVYICDITQHLFSLIVDFERKELCVREAEELLGLHGLRRTLSNVFKYHHPSRVASFSVIWAPVELPCCNIFLSKSTIQKQIIYYSLSTDNFLVLMQLNVSILNKHHQIIKTVFHIKTKCNTNVLTLWNTTILQYLL